LYIYPTLGHTNDKWWNKHLKRKYMEFEFSYEHERGFMPTYADIDWHSKWLANNDAEDTAVLFAVSQRRRDDILLELTQENCFIYLNATDPAFDVILIETNEEEAENWWVCRPQFGNDEFNELIYKIGEEATVIHSKYPMQHCAEFVLSVLEKDLNGFQSLADLPSQE